MGETCHTTSGGVESHRLNIEREAWAATPPAILHYTRQNVSESERWTDAKQTQTIKCAYCMHKHLHRHMKERICLENWWEAAAFISLQGFKCLMFSD